MLDSSKKRMSQNMRTKKYVITPTDDGMMDGTPKHGSWLDIAEIEINIMAMQCLGRRIEKIETFRSESAAWEAERNKTPKSIAWQFTTDDAGSH
jgi:hypothetical protein